jgi:hypothetical protein
MKLVKIFKEMLKEAEYTQGTFDFEYDGSSVISNIKGLEELNKWLSMHSSKVYKGSIRILDNQKITFLNLPDGLTVGSRENGVDDNVDLEGCSRLKTLPSNLTINGSINLSRCTGLRSLPNGLNVKESLNLIGCTKLKSLPKDLKCDMIWLLNTPISDEVDSEEDVRKMCSGIKGKIFLSDTYYR